MFLQQHLSADLALYQRLSPLTPQLCVPDPTDTVSWQNSCHARTHNGPHASVQKPRPFRQLGRHGTTEPAGGRGQGSIVAIQTDIVQGSRYQLSGHRCHQLCHLLGIACRHIRVLLQETRHVGGKDKRRSNSGKVAEHPETVRGGRDGHFELGWIAKEFRVGPILEKRRGGIDGRGPEEYGHGAGREYGRR